MTTPAKRPPRPFVPGVIRCVVHGTYGGPYNNIFHLACNSAPGISVTDLSTLATRLGNAYKANLLSVLASSCGIVSVDAQDIGSNVGNFVNVPVAGSGGDITSGNDANNVACCVSWHQPLHYRGGHPRTYLPGIRPTMRADTKTFTTAFQSALQAGANNFIAALLIVTGVTSSLVMVRYPYDKATNTWGTPSIQPIGSATVNLRVDSQRRRLGK